MHRNHLFIKPNWQKEEISSNFKSSIGLPLHVQFVQRERHSTFSRTNRGQDSRVHFFGSGNCPHIVTSDGTPLASFRRIGPRIEVARRNIAWIALLGLPSLLVIVVIFLVIVVIVVVVISLVSLF